MEDRDIIKLYTARSETAITETNIKYGTYCRSIAFHILGNSEDADECVNEALWNVWNSVPPQIPRDFRAYFAKITRNISLNRLEKQRAQKRGGKEMELVFEELSNCISDQSNFQSISDDIVIRETLNRFLKTLSEKERWMFVRRYWYADSVGDIARKLRMSENHVRVVLHRVRRKLKTVLEKEGVVI